MRCTLSASNKTAYLPAQKNMLARLSNALLGADPERAVELRRFGPERREPEVRARLLAVQHPPPAARLLDHMRGLVRLELLSHERAIRRRDLGAIEDDVDFRAQHRARVDVAPHGQVDGQRLGVDVGKVVPEACFHFSDGRERRLAELLPCVEPQAEFSRVQVHPHRQLAQDATSCRHRSHVSIGCCNDTARADRQRS